MAVAASTSQAPRTRYAKCGDLDIAYQVFGEGPVDLLMLPGPMIPIDSIDAEPSLYRFHRRLASFARVIRFDQRGTGLSSHVPASDPLGPVPWAQDALAVMDAIIDAIRPLGIEVRAGVHAGEVEVRGADIAGMAVHIAARVAALAGRSEVLTSSTVREIVTGSQRAFVEHGEHELKGVPGRWRVYSLVREQAPVRR